jgi:DnaK suppressor protein
VKKPLKTSSKTAAKKISPSSKTKVKVLAPAKKASKPSTGKAAPPKAVSQVKPVVKKAAPKSSAKPVTKPAAKPAAKAVDKSTPKSAVKVTSKVAAKPVSKTSSKAATKPATKPVAKPVSKSSVKPLAKASKAPVKPVSKAQAATKTAPKTASKAAAKPEAKSSSKPSTKPASKTVAKTAPQALAKQVSKPVANQAPAKPDKAAKPAKEEKNKSKTSVVAPVVAPAAEAPVMAADVPARAVRPSARLAQITVPSMAQSVASTAAKASYLQNMPTQVLTPPPFVAVKKDAKLANNWKTKKPEQLSDAEVMAMSDNEYMNDAQMAFFRLKLVALKQGILANAGETTEHLREDTVVVPDPADRATIEEEHALELRTRDRERKLLKKIEQSIQRIDAGDYGYCDETGEPIGVGRLLARPTANLSLEAQQRRELKQKMFGD